MQIAARPHRPESSDLRETYLTALVVAMLVGMLLGLSACAGREGEAEPAGPTPDAGVASLLLRDDLPDGVTWVSASVVGADAAVPGPGNRLLDQYRLRVLQAQQATYRSADGRTFDAVLTEVAGEWTNWPSIACDEFTSKDGQPLWSCYRDTPSGRRAMVAGVRGRLVLEVFAASDRPIGEGEVRFFIAQMQALPTLPPVPDVPLSVRRQAGQGFAERAGLTVGTTIMLLGGLAWLAASLRDRGTREVLRTVGHRPVVSPGIVDLAPRAGRVRMRAFLSALARLVILALVPAALVACPGLSIKAGSVLLVALLFIQFAVSARIAQRKVHVDVGSPTRWLHAGAAAVSSAFFVFMVSGFAFLWVFVREIGWSSHISWLFVVGTSVGLLRLSTLADRPLLYVRRLTQPSAQQVIQTDERREVLLLRSFQDDDLEIRTRPTPERALVDSVIRETATRFEEHIAWALWGVGPVVAIGQPGTVLQPLGAAREYYDDDSWQQAVESRMEHSAMIAMVVGRSPALQWEVARIRERGALAKTVFIFPPLERTETAQRLAVLGAALEMDLFDLLPRARRWPVALTFGADGDPRLLVADGRDDVAYAAALAAAADLVSRNAEARLSAPAASWRSDDRRDVSSLLAKFDPTKHMGRRRSWLSTAWDVLWPVV